MISRTFLRRTLVVLTLSACNFTAGAQANTASARLTGLQVDNLNAPLGIDDPEPRFSWQLSDPARGARQAAYEVAVFSSPALAAANKPDWSSGRVASDQSLNVRYAGPALEPSHRYIVRVKVWVAHGAAPAAPTPISAESTWETGLLHQDAWRADWIGYETAEEDAVRHAAAKWITSPDAAADAEGSAEKHLAFRQTVTLDKPVAHAALFATGEDTVSAWINGHQVLTVQAFPPWKQMPWKKFVRGDATAAVVAGVNTIAVETVHYIANPNGMADKSAPPTIATLFVEFTDGTTATLSTGSDWKTALHGPEGWQQPGFDDAAWKSAVAATTDSGLGEDSSSQLSGEQSGCLREALRHGTRRV
jgi:alpha-L-rhamnosidase